MRMRPWKAREEAAEQQADQAQAHYRQIRANRGRVDSIVTELRRNRTENGWTETVAKIFGGAL